MARKAREEERKPVGDNPDEWIAFADSLRKKNQQLFNGIYWAADLIEAAAVYVAALRAHDSCFGEVKQIVSDRIRCTCRFYKPNSEFFEQLNHHDPFFGVTIFLFDSYKKGEVLPQEIADVLCVAMECAYRELGKHYNLQEPAEKLAIDFRKLVLAFQNLRKGRFGVYRVVRAEFRFRHENHTFFENVLNVARGPSVELRIDEILSKLRSDTKWSLLPIRDIALMQSGRHHKKDEKYNVAVHVTHKVDSSFWDSVLVTFGAIITAAIHQGCAWRAKKLHPLPEPPKVLPRQSTPESVEDDAAEFAKALENLVNAKAGVEKETPYYRGERKSRPKTPLSAQTSPKANSQLARLDALLNIKFPVKPTLKFNEGVLALQMVSIGYFNALNDCARTPYLQMLTLTAKDSASRFFLFMGLTAGLTDPKERKVAMLKLNEYFRTFGESMATLAAGFEAFERELNQAKVKGDEVSEKEAARMIGISTRQLRNWLNWTHRPEDFPGISKRHKLVEWLILNYPKYGRDYVDELRRKQKGKGSGNRVSYKENLKEHQDPDKSGRN